MPGSKGQFSAKGSELLEKGSKSERDEQVTNDLNLKRNGMVDPIFNLRLDKTHSWRGYYFNGVLQLLCQCLYVELVFHVLACISLMSLELIVVKVTHSMRACMYA